MNAPLSSHLCVSKYMPKWAWMEPYLLLQIRGTALVRQVLHLTGSSRAGSTFGTSNAQSRVPSAKPCWLTQTSSQHPSGYY